MIEDNPDCEKGKGTPRGFRTEILLSRATQDFYPLEKNFQQSTWHLSSLHML